jgi:hypothetical protein
LSTIASRVIQIIATMSPVVRITTHHPRLLKSKIEIQCTACEQIQRVTVEAAYRQYKRGHPKYCCKKCAGKKGWNEARRAEAKVRSTQLWKDPTYRGTITGRAVARDVIAKSL